MTQAEPCRCACITTKPLEHCGLQLEERSLPSSLSPFLPSLAVANLTELKLNLIQTNKGSVRFCVRVGSEKPASDAGNSKMV